MKTLTRVPKKRVGVIGTFVWDVIHGRDARSSPVEEWGGVTYTLSGLDAALPDEWEIVPIIKDKTSQLLPLNCFSRFYSLRMVRMNVLNPVNLKWLP